MAVRYVPLDPSDRFSGIVEITIETSDGGCERPKLAMMVRIADLMDADQYRPLGVDLVE